MCRRLCWRDSVGVFAAKAFCIFGGSVPKAAVPVPVALGWCRLSSMLDDMCGIPETKKQPCVEYRGENSRGCYGPRAENAASQTTVNYHLRSCIYKRVHLQTFAELPFRQSSVRGLPGPSRVICTIQERSKWRKDTQGCVLQASLEQDVVHGSRGPRNGCPF